MNILVDAQGMKLVTDRLADMGLQISRLIPDVESAKQLILRQSEFGREAYELTKILDEMGDEVHKLKALSLGLDDSSDLYLMTEVQIKDTFES